MYSGPSFSSFPVLAIIKLELLLRFAELGATKTVPAGTLEFEKFDPKLWFMIGMLVMIAFSAAKLWGLERTAFWELETTVEKFELENCALEWLKFKFCKLDCEEAEVLTLEWVAFGLDSKLTVLEKLELQVTAEAELKLGLETKEVFLRADELGTL